MEQKKITIKAGECHFEMDFNKPSFDLFFKSKEWYDAITTDKELIEIQETYGVDLSRLFKKQLNQEYRKMKVEQYMQDCQRTLPDLGSLKLNLSHMALGMGSEINELSEAILSGDKVNIGEELADICWYAGNLSTMIGFGSINHEITFKEDDKRTLEDFISLCQNTIKRYVAYDKQISGGEEVWLQMYVDSIFKNIEILCALYDLDFEQILENNINKLKIRFPEKFTTDNALNRNLAKEYATLGEKL